MMEDSILSSSATTHMAPFAMSSPFTRAYCLADGQLTPPSSPDLLQLPTSRHGPRLQLSKLLKRRRSTKSHRFATVQGMETTSTRTSVLKMKLPFSLILPESPNRTEYSSISTCSPSPTPELRRVPTTRQDLRSFAARQPPLKPLPADTPLLPSPIIDTRAERSTSYFPFSNLRLERSGSDYASYEDLHILSCYSDELKIANMERIAMYEEGDEEPDCPVIGNEDEDGSTASEYMPETPKDNSRRATTCSEEADWLANTTSHTERVRRFKARCYQIVQHPFNSASANSDEDGIMLATVLVGPGKPKLVQISRPTSGFSPRDSRIELDVARPRTPMHQNQEISAFSPYDTPSDRIDACSDPSPTYGEHINTTPDECFSSLSLIPAPVTPASTAHSTHSSSTAFSSTMQRLQSLADPFRWSPRQITNIAHRRHKSNGTQSAKASTYTLRPPNHSSPFSRSHIPSPTPHHLPPASSQTKTKLHTQLLSVITSAIQSFPSHILRLDSATIRALRSPYTTDSTYLSAFARIFPRADPLLLSALVSWVLVDAFIEGLQRGQDNNGDGDGDGDDNDDGDKEALKPEMATQARREREREMERRRYYDRVAAASNESLHRIPHKARERLGIHLSPSPSPSSSPPSYEEYLRYRRMTSRLEREAVRHRAAVMGASVGVIGLKLMEAVNTGNAGGEGGAGGWDEDLWRSLRVLVGVIEAGGRERVWV